MSGENIQHFGAIRLRVNGTGNLKPKFLSLDDVRTLDLVPIIMATLTDREPTRLANFMSQRARLRLGTTEKDEIFKINRVIIFVKETYSEYAG